MYQRPWAEKWWCCLCIGVPSALLPAICKLGPEAHLAADAGSTASFLQVAIAVSNRGKGSPVTDTNEWFMEQRLKVWEKILQLTTELFQTLIFVPWLICLLMSFKPWTCIYCISDLICKLVTNNNNIHYYFIKKPRLCFSCCIFLPNYSFLSGH